MRTPPADSTANAATGVVRHPRVPALRRSGSRSAPAKQMLCCRRVRYGHSFQRAAVRATWRGVVGVDAGPYRAGQQLIAHMAGLLAVRDGVVVEHETFDCCEPLSTA